MHSNDDLQSLEIQNFISNMTKEAFPVELFLIKNKQLVTHKGTIQLISTKGKHTLHFKEAKKHEN